MASPGWAALGSTIAGGNKLNSELAYDQGEALGARTQDALAQARGRVMQNNARDTADSALQGLIPDPKARAAAVNAIQRGENPADIFNAVKTNQEIGFRGQIADLNTPDAQVVRNRLALGNSADFLHPVGTEGSYVNELHPEQGVNMSDLGKQIGRGKVLESQASVNEKNASADRSRSQADLNNQAVAGGGKAPTGFRYTADENGNAKLEPIPGGPKDPNGPGAPLGSREASQLNRVIGGGKQSLAALQSILSAPVGGNTGVFGIGAAPGHNLLQSTLDTMRNKASSEDTQQYNTMLPGLSRGLAAIESMGLVPSGTFIGSFDNLAFREGDTEETRLHKLAEFRQIIDNGMDVLAHNERLPKSQIQYVKEIQDQVRKVIPFTHADLFAMKSIPGGTVQDMVNAHNVPAGVSAVAPPAAAPSAAAPAAVPPVPPAAAPPVAKPPARAAFDTPDQVEAAFKAGKVKLGDRIMVGGKMFTVQQ